MGGGGNGCGSGLLVVTSNKLVTFPRWNSIRLSGPCCSVWGMDGKAFAFRAHAAPFGECNYNLMCSYYMLKISHKSAMYASCNSNKINVR